MVTYLVLLSGTAAGQTHQPKPGKTAGSKITSFIPMGYTVLDSVRGDVNGDGAPDMILVLKKAGEDTTYDPVPARIFMVLTGTGGCNFKVAVANKNVVYTHDLGGVSNPEPYSKTEIHSKTSFSVTHWGGMGSGTWENTATFKYSPTKHNWHLYKTTESMTSIQQSENNDSLDASGVETVKTDKDFGRIWLDKYNYKLLSRD